MISNSLASFAGFFLDQEYSPLSGSPYSNARMRVHHVLRSINRAGEESGSPYQLDLEEVPLLDGKTAVHGLIVFNRLTHRTKTIPMSVTAQLVRIRNRVCFIGLNSRPSSLLYELVAEIEDTLDQEGAE